MSQENIAVIVRLVEARNAGDHETIFKSIDPDAEWQPTGLFVDDPAIYRGRDEIMRYLERLDEQLDDLRFELKDLIGTGDLVVADVYASGVGKESRVPVEVRYALVSRWRNGKLLSARNYMTRREALEAAGLSDQDAHADS